MDSGNSFKTHLLDFINGNKIRVFAIILVTISALAYYPTVDSDYDIWFHLKYGEHFVKNITWDIDHSVFSWTPAEANWKYVTWVGSSIFYIVYQLASIPGLYILQWLVFLSIAGLYVYYTKSIKDTFDISSVTGIMLVAIAVNLEANIVKPELFTFLFFAAAAFIYFYGKSTSKNLFFIYPFLFLIWVNTHGGFIFGLLFIGIVLTGETLSFFLLKKSSMTKGMLKSLFAAVVLSYVVLLINPYGVEYPAGLFRYLTSMGFAEGTEQILAYRNLWNFLFVKGYEFRFMNTAWIMVIMLSLIIVSSVYAYRKSGKLDITVVGLNILFFYIGMRMGRAVIFFPLIWFFSVLYTLKSADLLTVKKKLGPAALVVLLFFAGNVAYNTACYMKYRSWFGFNAGEFTPVKEVAFIKKHKLPGPIFNDYLIGSYMLWSMYPEYKVFIDTRQGPYVEQVLLDYAFLKNNLTSMAVNEFAKKYRFKTILLHFNETDMILLLQRSPDWALVYFDKVAAVFVNKSELSSLSSDVFSEDLGPLRFKGISNSFVLVNIFNIYMNMPLEPAQKALVVRMVFEIYKMNMSNLYKGKQHVVKEMERIITGMKAQFMPSPDERQYR